MNRNAEILNNEGYESAEKGFDLGLRFVYYYALARIGSELAEELMNHELPNVTQSLLTGAIATGALVIKRLVADSPPDITQMSDQQSPEEQTK